MPKCTKIRLADGLRPDPLEELKRSPIDALATIKVVLFLRKEREGGREGMGEGWNGQEGEEGEKKEENGQGGERGKGRDMLP